MESQLAQVLMEVATGRWWEVVETSPRSARVFPGGNTIGMPLSSDEEATYVRLHEMAHAVLSPQGGAQDAAANAAEDCRLLAYLLSPRMASSIREVFLGGYHRWLPPGHVPSTGAAIAMLGHEAAAADREWLKREHPIVWQDVLLVGSLLRTAVWHPETGWRKKKPPPGDAAILAEALRMLRMPPEAVERHRQTETSLRWAPMRLREDAAASRRRPLLSEEGFLLKAPLNVLTQSPTFEARRRPLRRQPQATYLVDASSSMKWRSLSEIFERLPPHSRVALYGATSPQQGGELIVAPTTLHTWHDNLIDGPALRWLAKQPGRRYWMTDGGVTGVTSQGVSGTSPLLQLEVRALCQRAGITRITR